MGHMGRVFRYLVLIPLGDKICRTYVLLYGIRGSARIHQAWTEKVPVKVGQMRSRGCFGDKGNAATGASIGLIKLLDFKVRDCRPRNIASGITPYHYRIDDPIIATEYIGLEVLRGRTRSTCNSLIIGILFCLICRAISRPLGYFFQM